MTFVVNRLKEKSIEFLVEVKNILTDFSDEYPEELLNKLPWLHDIQHAIDLVLGTSSPNLPIYSISPTKHAELNRLVDELLVKGFIQESLSPCGVPTSS